MTEPVATGYAAALAELETILGELERADVDVDVLATKVKRAAELIGFCRDRIGNARPGAVGVAAKVDHVGPVGGESLCLLLDFLAEHPWRALLGVGYKALPLTDILGEPVIGDNMYLTTLVPGTEDLFLLNRYGPHWSEIPPTTS
jgi:exodeoxyribonuclease VII small subunit